MRFLFTLCLLLGLQNLAFSQKSADPSDFKLMFKPDTTTQYIGAVDSLNLFMKSNSNSFGKSSNGIIQPHNTIESNGYRGANGVLYTMRIKVPKNNHAAIREYDWSTPLDSIDQRMIYTPVKKK